MWKIRVLFKNWPGILCTGCFGEIVDLLRMLESHPLQKMITHNILNVFLSFKTKLCRFNSVRDALRVLLFIYHNFLRTTCFLSKWIRAYNFVPVGILDFWKKSKIKNFHKNDFSYHMPTLWTSTHNPVHNDWNATNA